MKIPTILGLFLLTIIIILAVFIYSYRQRNENQTKLNSTPKNIRIVNIDDSSASISWQTLNHSLTELLFGTNSLDNQIGDDRDLNPEKRLTHFVTLKNLNPDTKYQLKIKNGPYQFPEDALTFTTREKKLQFSNNLQPLVGTVVNKDLTPAREAIVYLRIDQKIEFGTFTTTAGNYLLPLSALQITDQTISEKEVELVVEQGALQSLIKITLSTNNPSIPPIVLGNNHDFREALSTSSGKLKNFGFDEDAELIQQEVLINQSEKNKFDLNNDSVVNSLDLVKVIQIIDKKLYDRRVDFNNDKKVNLKDSDLLKKSFPAN